MPTATVAKAPPRKTGLSHRDWQVVVTRLQLDFVLVDNRIAMQAGPGVSCLWFRNYFRHSLEYLWPAADRTGDDFHRYVPRVDPRPLPSRS